MHLVEYRICLPFTVEEYKRAQLYMIARHCDQESDRGEGVEVVKYEPCHDPVHGEGHYTEKRVHLYNKLPTWMQSFIPNMFYVEEKSWNYYPFTITEYTAHNLPPEELSQRNIEYLDIVQDSVAEHKYRESEDPRKVTIKKTNPPRGPLKEGWVKESQQKNIPIMCSYKVVRTKFEVWGLQTKVEAWTQRTIRDILLLAHRQAFCWTDEWYEKSYETIVAYERETYNKTNEKVVNRINSSSNFQQKNNTSNNSSSKANATATATATAAATESSEKNVADFD